MRISDRYIGKQVLVGTLYAVLVLSLVLVMGNLFQKVRPLLVEQKVPLGVVLQFALNVLPYSLMFTLPWGFLSAVLLVFGRMSSHQEITSFRVAGVSLPRLAVPVFVLGLLLSGLSLWLNVNVVPTAKASVYHLLYQRAISDPRSLLKPGVVQHELRSDGGGQAKLLIEGFEERTGDWVVGFHCYLLPAADNKELTSTYIHARRAALSVDTVKRQLHIKVVDGYFESVKPDGSVEMVLAGEAEPMIFSLKKRSRSTKANAMTNEAIAEYVRLNPGLSESRKLGYRNEVARRYSFSMACFAFAFIAVPLGLKARRTDTSSGLIMSLALGAGYFLFTLLADQFESEEAAIVLLWLPNIACILIGLYLFRRARFK